MSPAGDSRWPRVAVEIPEDDSLAWQVIRSGQTVCRPDGVNGAGSLAADPICALDPGASLVALAPLRSSDVTMGLVYLAFDQANELSPGVRKLLDPVADIASNAIQRAKLLQTLEQQVSDRTRRLKILYDVSAAASQSFDLYPMLLSALQTLVAAMPGCAGALLLLDDETSCRPPLVQSELSEEIVAALEQGFLPEAPWTRVLRDGLTLRLSKGVRRPARAGLAAESGLAGLPGRARPGNRRDGGRAEPVLAVGATPHHRRPGIDLDRCRRNRPERGAVGAPQAGGAGPDRGRTAAPGAGPTRLHHPVAVRPSPAGRGKPQLCQGRQRAPRPSRTWNKLVETAHQALKEMRLMIYNLRPSVLAAEGLVGAINWRLEAVEQRAGIKAQLVGEITALALEAGGRRPVPGGAGAA